MPHPRAFLDVDIDGHRAAHARACAFVAATSLRYGLSSPVLADIGGSERARLPELYASDYEWQSKGRLELSPAPCERLVVELFEDAAPNCVANFLALCTGSKGKAKGSGVPLHYKGTRFFRQTAFMIQGGDVVFSNGAGGESIWGGTFKDERGALALKHDARGLVSMSNAGKNSNGSQFFILLQPRPQLNGKHCVFGRVVEGFAVLDAVEAVPVSEGERPLKDIVVVDCGAL